MINFMEVAKCLRDVSDESSNLGKEELLLHYGIYVRGFKEVLKFIYDPYFTTGIKLRKLYNANVTDRYRDITVEQLMAYLKQNSTGTMQDCEYANDFIYADEDADWQWAATGLVTKDLQIGVSVTTLNKVYGKDFIPKIGIMRGMLCPEDAKGFYIVTEKIDGNRRLIFNRESGVEIYTRSGKRDNGLYAVEQSAMLLPNGYVYDCECIAEGNFGDSIELRQASASILNRRNTKRDGVVALCFDMLPIVEYNNGVSRFSALARKAMLAQAMGDKESVGKLIKFAMQLDMHNAENGKPTHLTAAVTAVTNGIPSVATEHIKPLPVLGIATNKVDGIEYAQKIWNVGGEGVMMVDYKSSYEVNPNPRKTLLKIKLSKEFVCKCVNVFEGSGKYEDSLGGIVVKYISDGEPWLVKVGTGFTDYDRDYYWVNRDKIIGKMVEIESFGESNNAAGGKSLNCPVFKRIRGEEE